MMFHEIYGSYYQTVARVLRTAVDHPLAPNELKEIITGHAFGESEWNIESALREERWQLIRKDGTPPIRKKPTCPLTLLEKRWLKAILMDPRIQLFMDAGCDAIPDFIKIADAGELIEVLDLSDVEPLFSPEDIRVFDRYDDGDPYENPVYQRNFRTVLSACRTHSSIVVDSMNRKGRIRTETVVPEYLEYSEKDDKFRLVGTGSRYGGMINLARIIRCKVCEEDGMWKEDGGKNPKNSKEDGKKKLSGEGWKETTERKGSGSRMVEFELIDQRNALERALLHFAHFEKEAERIERNRYRIRVRYDKDDETELVIRVLSFGPMIRVTAPEVFVDLIRKRLIRQKHCFLKNLTEKNV